MGVSRSRTLHRRIARGTAALLVSISALSLAPALAVPANAAPRSAVSTRASANTQCAAAQAALAQARAQRRAAHLGLVKARHALVVARAKHRPAVARRAARTAARLLKAYNAAGKSATFQQGRVGFACSAPTSAARANGTGRALKLLATAKGLSVGTLDPTQLTTLLNQLLPGVVGSLSPDQLTALLAGFNSGPVSGTDALTLLTGVLSPAQIEALLSGNAGADELSGLADDILGELGDLGGGLPVPDSVDPTEVLNTIAGMFGDLNPTQIGNLLGLLTTAVGQGGTTFSADQLSTLVDALIPGIDGSFGPADMASMLAALNGPNLDAAGLAALLGGRFGPGDLSQVLAGTASPQLIADVMANVLAQLKTAGAGGLNLPTHLDPTTAASLISTITAIFTTMLAAGSGGGSGGGGGGLGGGGLGGGGLGSLCSLVPIPLLCP